MKEPENPMSQRFFGYAFVLLGCGGVAFGVIGFVGFHITQGLILAAGAIMTIASGVVRLRLASKQSRDSDPESGPEQ